MVPGQAALWFFGDSLAFSSQTRQIRERIDTVEVARVDEAQNTTPGKALTESVRSTAGAAAAVSAPLGRSANSAKLLSFLCVALRKDSKNANMRI
jgi:hypothetical protein